MERADASRASARALRLELALLEVEVAPGRFDENSSDYRSAYYDDAKEKFERQVQGALDGYLDGRLDLREAERRFNDAIGSAYRSAYADGAARWGGQARLDAEDQRWLKGAISGEANFARRFLDDAASLSEAQVAQRAGLYVDGLDSVRTAGWVAKSPDGTVFYWLLGVAQHCGDCPALAAQSPYTKETLPTFPRAGDSSCGSRCKCSLIVGQGSQAPKALAASQAEQRAYYGNGPAGAEPTPVQRDRIDDLRSEVNYWRRQTDRAPTDVAELRAAKERQRANDDLLGYLRQNGLREVPLLSVGEVLTGADARPAAIEQILERGIDGRSLAAVSQAGFDEGYTKLLEQFQARWSR